MDQPDIDSFIASALAAGVTLEELGLASGIQEDHGAPAQIDQEPEEEFGVITQRPQRLDSRPVYSLAAERAGSGPVYEGKDNAYLFTRFYKFASELINIPIYDNIIAGQMLLGQLIEILRSNFRNPGMDSITLFTKLLGGLENLEYRKMKQYIYYELYRLYTRISQQNQYTNGFI